MIAPSSSPYRCDRLITVARSIVADVMNRRSSVAMACRVSTIARRSLFCAATSPFTSAAWAGMSAARKSSPALAVSCSLIV